MSIETHPHPKGNSTPYDTLIDDNGDVMVPDEYDALGEEYDFAYEQKNPVVPEVVIGPSTRLDERYVALAAMSKRYKEYASAVGFKAASASDKKRPALRRTYANLDLMANDKLARARYTTEVEKSVLMPLLKTDELLAAGFQPMEVEEVEQETIHSVRNNFGHRVGHTKRNRSMNSINKPTNIE
jgi:hypothetical protein